MRRFLLHVQPPGAIEYGTLGCSCSPLRCAAQIWERFVVLGRRSNSCHNYTSRVVVERLSSGGTPVHISRAAAAMVAWEFFCRRGEPPRPGGRVEPAHLTLDRCCPWKILHAVAEFGPYTCKVPIAPSSLYPQLVGLVFRQQR